MNVEDLRNFFDVANNAELSRKIKIAKSTLSGWEKIGIPTSTQAEIEILSKGKLKADLSKSKLYSIHDRQLSV